MDIKIRRWLCSISVNNMNRRTDEKNIIIYLNNSGFSLVEILIAMSVLSILAIANMTMFSNQQKITNYIDFNSKRTQLQNLISSMVLNNSNNCRCLFEGAHPFLSDPSLPGLTLQGSSPTKIGHIDL